MTKYFYYDWAGTKQGPVSEEQFKELLAKRVISRYTMLETEDGSVQFEALRLPNLFPERQAQPPCGIFDIGFTRFISNTWISIIWGILITAHIIGAVVCLFAALNNGDPRLFLVALVVVPVSLLLCRMSLELNVIFFRIESNTRESKECLREIKELLAQK